REQRLDPLAVLEHHPAEQLLHGGQGPVDAQRGPQRHQSVGDAGVVTGRGWGAEGVDGDPVGPSPRPRGLPRAAARGRGACGEEEGSTPAATTTTTTTKGPR